MYSARTTLMVEKFTLHNIPVSTPGAIGWGVLLGLWVRGDPF